MSASFSGCIWHRYIWLCTRWNHNYLASVPVYFFLNIPKVCNDIGPTREACFFDKVYVHHTSSSWKKPSKWLGWFQRNVPQLASGHRIYIPYLTVFYPKPLLENSFKTAGLILIKLSTTNKWALKLWINNKYYFNFNSGLKNSDFRPIVHLKVKYIPITQKTKVFEIRWAPLHEDF